MSGHRSHQMALAIHGARAADAAAILSQLRGQVPIVVAFQLRSLQILISRSFIAVAGGAGGEERRAGLRDLPAGFAHGAPAAWFPRIAPPFHVILAHHAERHRAHAHPLNVAELHAACAVPEFFQLFLHVPGSSIPAMLGAPISGFPDPSGLMAWRAVLKKFLARAWPHLVDPRSASRGAASAETEAGLPTKRIVRERVPQLRASLIFLSVRFGGY